MGLGELAVGRGELRRRGVGARARPFDALSDACELSSHGGLETRLVERRQALERDAETVVRARRHGGEGGENREQESDCEALARQYRDHGSFAAAWPVPSTSSE